MSDSLSTLLDPRELARRFLAGGMVGVGLPEVGRMQDYGAGLGAYPGAAPLAGLPGLPGLMRPRQVAPQVLDASQAPQLPDDSQSPQPRAPQAASSEDAAAAGPQDVAEGLGIAPGAPDVPPFAYAPPMVPSGGAFGIVAKAESSGNPTAQGPQTSSGQARGLFQITDGTWQDFAPPFILRMYPTADKAPPQVQQEVAATIPIGRWAPSTVEALRRQYGDIDPRQPLGQLAGADPTGGPAGAMGPPGAPGMAGGAYGPYTQNIEDARRIAQAQQADAERIVGQFQPRLAADMAQVDRATAAVRPPQTQPWTQQLPDPGLVKEFGSWGSVFAALASGFTRRPMINAMNGLAGSINALHKGDVEEYNRQYQAWKENTDLAFKNYETERQASDDAIKKLSTDQNAALNDLRLNAAKYDNQWQLNAVESGAIGHLIEANDAQQRLYIQLGNAQRQMEKDHEQQQILFDLQEAQGLSDSDPDKQKKIAQVETRANNFAAAEGKTLPFPNAPGVIGAKGSGTVPMPPPEDIKSMGARVAMGEPLNQVVPGWGSAYGPERNAVMHEAAEQLKAANPGMTDEQAGQALAQARLGYVAGGRSVTQLTLMQGGTRQALSQLEFNIGKAKEEMAKLPSTDLSPVLNAIARGAESWTGDPAYAGLFTFMYAVAAESARIFAGGVASTAQLHQGAMDEAQKFLNINMTPASFDEVAKGILAEGENRLDNYQQAIKMQMPGSSAGASSGPSATTTKPQGTDRFVTGKIYTDANGNRAKYLGNGKWEEQ